MTIYTTRDVSRICGVSPREVSKWFDSGRLRGYRIPGSQDRRIPREHLLRFFRDYPQFDKRQRCQIRLVPVRVL